MNVKEQWLDNFQELLWGHHSCDWDVGNRYPEYPFNLAKAHFSLGADGLPAESVEEAFARYLED